MADTQYDICIIGGGINGTGIARDAAGRGLKVLLLEQGDLAQATSSNSTKLIHGGLRYLEFYEFSLVREALKERAKLLKIAPHIIWPLRFILPHHKDIRPLWMIRAGLFLYDALAGKSQLQRSKFLRLDKGEYGAPLKENFKKGFSYADCWVQDARLVVLNAMDARDRGADILTQTKCLSLKEEYDSWNIKAFDKKSGREKEFSAAMVVNAAGPWVENLLQGNDFYSEDKEIPHIKLVKGSHIIVPRQYVGDHAYILQQKDGRIVFSIPYEEEFTLIGTTDVPYDGDPLATKISDAEINYLCNAVNSFFKAAITPEDVKSTYSGVRALFDDGEEEARAVTRDYKLYSHETAAPMISIFGGKITTYRHLAEDSLAIINKALGKNSKGWSADECLPGGDIAGGDVQQYYKGCSQKYPWMPEKMLRRFIVHYGTRLEKIIGPSDGLTDLGTHYGADVYEAEIDYVIAQEFVSSAEDFLWRRTKLGLHTDEQTQDKIERAIAAKTGSK